MANISLDYTGNYNRFDSDDMYEQIISLPEQIKTAYVDSEVSDFAKYYKNIEKIIICGMGGSAIAGDLIKSIFEKDIPIVVIKDYHIPEYTDENTLGIVCSYSGNTEETVTCFKSFREAGAQIAMLTSDGILKHYSKEEGYLIKELPAGFQPRAAIGYLFFSLLKILQELGLVPDASVEARMAIINVKNRLKYINKDVEEDDNIAKKFAKKIYKKMPIIYSSNPKLYPLAYRLKCQFNENAKNHAFANAFSEMNHNEIEGWEGMKNDEVIPIFIRNFEEDERYKKRLEVIQELFKKNNIEFLEIVTQGKTELGKIFSTILMGDLVSFYLAILNKVNPSSIKYIDFLKESI